MAENYFLSNCNVKKNLDFYILEGPTDIMFMEKKI